MYDPKTNKIITNPFVIKEMKELEKQDVSVLSAEDKWLNPEKPKYKLYPVRPFNKSIMPEPLWGWIDDVSHRMQSPPEYIAVGLITVISSIIGARCCIKPKKYDSWFVVPNFWGMIIGNPSSLKTPSLNECIQFSKKLEAESWREYQEAKHEYDFDERATKIKRDEIYKTLGKIQSGKDKSDRSEEELKATFFEIEDPEEPKCKRYYTNDTTIEKLSELLRDNPQGLLIYRDELAGFLTSLEKEGNSQDRAYMLEGWSGWGGFTTDRIGRGTTRTENVCLSLLGTIQPSRLRQYIYQSLKNIGNDGLIQRFQLMVYPNPIKDWVLVDDKPNEQAYSRVHDLVMRLAEIDFTTCGDQPTGSKKPPAFNFGDEAQEWITVLEKEKIPQNEEGFIIEHLTKYRSLVPALALIFHLIDIADQQAQAGEGVSAHALETAIRFSFFLETHAMRVYSMVMDMTAQAANTLLQRLRKQELENGFTLRTLQRKGWQNLNTRDLAEAACDELVRLGWLKEEQKGSSRGGPKKTTYTINPKLLKD